MKRSLEQIKNGFRAKNSLRILSKVLVSNDSKKRGGANIFPAAAALQFARECKKHPSIVAATTQKQRRDAIASLFSRLSERALIALVSRARGVPPPIALLDGESDALVLSDTMVAPQLAKAERLQLANFVLRNSDDALFENVSRYDLLGRVDALMLSKLPNPIQSQPSIEDLDKTVFLFPPHSRKDSAISTGVRGPIRHRTVVVPWKDVNENDRITIERGSLLQSAELSLSRQRRFLKSWIAENLGDTGRSFFQLWKQHRETTSWSSFIEKQLSELDASAVNEIWQIVTAVQVLHRVVERRVRILKPTPKQVLFKAFCLRHGDDRVFATTRALHGAIRCLPPEKRQAFDEYCRCHNERELILRVPRL